MPTQTKLALSRRFTPRARRAARRPRRNRGSIGLLYGRRFRNPKALVAIAAGDEPPPPPPYPSTDIPCIRPIPVPVSRITVPPAAGSSLFKPACPFISSARTSKVTSKAASLSAVAAESPLSSSPFRGPRHESYPELHTQ
jgi:hypothetical protein